MGNYDYLIIGGGMTAAAAVKGIREVDPRGSIGVFSAEDHPPYKRPPLTKKLWTGKPENSVWIDLPAENLELMTGCQVIEIDVADKRVRDDQGRVSSYGKLLLATGGTPRRLPFGPDEIVYFRTLDDYRTTRSWTGKGAHIGVIGGGFIGSEIAAALSMNGERVSLFFPEPSIGSRIFPADLSEYISGYYRQKGIQVNPGMKIQAIERLDAQFILHGEDGRETRVDQLIAGLGIQPNTELARKGGIHLADQESGSGILVDEFLRTGQADIYAAGDVASFVHPVFGSRRRVEHEDNANSMGRIAGLNMAGQQTAYHHQPYFYSDLFDLGYEAVGTLDSRLEVVADWREKYHQGVLYYLKDQVVVGVLLWNTWDQVDAARALISEKKEVKPSDLIGRLPQS